MAALKEKHAVFFSMRGYSQHAVECAVEASMALFTYDSQGTPFPTNGIARELLAAADQRAVGRAEV